MTSVQITVELAGLVQLCKLECGDWFRTEGHTWTLCAHRPAECVAARVDGSADSPTNSMRIFTPEAHVCPIERVEVKIFMKGETT